MTVDVDAAAAAALALPGVTEADHHGRRSFRVGGGKVLATVPADGVLNVLVGEDLAHAVSAQPGVELLWWGQKLSGVRVELALVDAALLDELLQDAWARRAPAALRRPEP
ncbi:MmcQ/YjbR family DNA-binding protein [Modestobacter versicolor]|uniref:MmcQ/YjbR family DNA-binding protein n=1 Tax=Modestobacter versicolor TaxID=429133 RepID=A0A323V9F6_9ACTN|nr:MmcQ/YjbR family DNA-binding protein [Modestobacter versicolor]